MQSGLFDLGVAHVKLLLESKGPMPPAEITRSSVEAVLSLERHSEPVRMRCHEVCFLALDAALKQIRAALKAGKKK